MFYEPVQPVAIGRLRSCVVCVKCSFSPRALGSTDLLLCSRELPPQTLRRKMEPSGTNPDISQFRILGW
ncbi:hypothetical protein Q8A73_001091 [Channa argus]|nr:hypothetical protein Q8A73_001091 [Channa argus]